MQFPSSIRVRLAVFAFTSIAITALVATAGALLLRWTHANDSQLTVDVAANLRNSQRAPEQLVTTQTTLQALMRVKDPDEIEANLKNYETWRSTRPRKSAGSPSKSNRVSSPSTPAVSSC